MEILEVGTEAETCMMAGRGMNGLRGCIVCFNENNQRYTLELDSGEMMSLRARNVKAVGTDDDTSVSDNKEKESPPPSENATKKSPSSLPKSPAKNHDFHDDDDTATTGKSSVQKEGNIFDRFVYAVFGAFMDMSPSVLLLAIGAAYVAKKLFAGDGSYESDDEGGSSSRTRDYYDYGDYYVPRRHWWGGWYHRHWPWYWGWYGVSGMFSVLVVGFFVWQFGTKKGETDFSWLNVKTRVVRMDFWEVMRYGFLLEGAIMFMMRVARDINGGGGRDRRRR